MKRFLILLFIALYQFAHAQTVDYNKVILPDKADSVSIAEKLVQLAWKNYPLNEIANLQVKAAQKAVTIAKLEWTNLITGQVNLNENNFRNGVFTSIKDDPDNPYGNINNQFPRYNVGLAVSLGTFITTPAKVKKEKVGVMIAESNVQAQKLKIRAEMLKRYETYLSSIEILKLRVKAVEEAHLIYLLVTKKFRKGEAILEDYNKSFLTYNTAQEARVLAESQMYLTKVAIEEMIGLKLEEVTGTQYQNQKVDKKGDTLILASGLKYVVNEPGFGEKPKSGQSVKVFYRGKFMNGKEFENNLKDDPFRVTLGVQQVIQGWEEGILLMKEGEKGTLIIPARMAYGHQGIKDPSNEGAYMVPPDTPVVYEIELVDVK